MPKRTSRNSPKAKAEPTSRSSPPAVGSRQSEDPQSEFSVPQKWKENAQSDAAIGSSSAAGGERGPVVEGSEPVDRS